MFIKDAFKATSKKRDTLDLITYSKQAVERIRNSSALSNLWKDYQNKYVYAQDISYKDTINSVERLLDKLL